MERLTERNERGVPHPKRTCNKCIEFDDKILIGCSRECEYDIISKLADYEEAEENGLLLKLPCKIGDIIYDEHFGEITPCKVTGFSIGQLYTDGLYGDDEEDEESESDGSIIVHYKSANDSYEGSFPVDQFGTHKFHKKEEAEAKLKENVR